MQRQRGRRVWLRQGVQLISAVMTAQLPAVNAADPDARPAEAGAGSRRGTAMRALRPMHSLHLSHLQNVSSAMALPLGAAFETLSLDGRRATRGALNATFEALRVRGGPARRTRRAPRRQI